MLEPRDELAALSAALRHRLERERQKGTSALRLPEVIAPSGASKAKGPTSPPKPAAPAVAAKTPAPATAPQPVAAPRGNKLSLIDIEAIAPDHADRMARLKALGHEASGCEKCGLCETRTKVVFARGAARHRVMFIGEAPGADEDAQGYPFVGRAGKLLDQIIDATGFHREEIYVANILKCRPPKNRDPKPEEIVACTPYLQQQIELVAPRVICALGKFASQFLTDNPKATMGQLRGKMHRYQGTIPVVPTYHPAALLRNPNWKRVVWEDMQVLREVYLKLSGAGSQETG